MNKKFIKLCLASILSLSLNTNLQAQELPQTTFTQEEEEDITEDTLSEVESFIQEARDTYGIEITFRPENREIVFCKMSFPLDQNIDNVITDFGSLIEAQFQNQSIETILESLSRQEWCGSLEALTIQGYPHEIDALQNVLSETPQLRKLEISNLELGEGYLAGIGELWPILPNLQILNLNTNIINGSAMVNLVNAFSDVEGFEGFPNLQTLTLRMTRLETLDEANLQAFAQFLSFTPNLKELDLSCNNLGEKVAVLAPVIAQMSNLQILRLGDCEINESTMINFANAFLETEDLKELHTLDIYHNEIGTMGDAGLQAFVTFLSCMPNLKELHLSYNNLGEKVVVLAPAIAQMSNLQILRLSDCEINESTMINFANAFSETEDLKELHTLDISYNEIGTMGAEGLQAFVTFLSRLPNLKKLDLSYTQLKIIEENDLEELFYALSLIPNLQELNLNENELREKLVILAPAIARMTNLKALHLSNNSIDKFTITSLMNVISQLENFEIPNLTLLDLEYNNLGEPAMDDEGWQTFVNFLSCIPQLSTLYLNLNGFNTLNEVSERFLVHLPSDIQLNLHLGVDEIVEEDEDEEENILAGIAAHHPNINITID